MINLKPLIKQILIAIIVIVLIIIIWRVFIINKNWFTFALLLTATTTILTTSKAIKNKETPGLKQLSRTAITTFIASSALYLIIGLAFSLGVLAIIVLILGLAGWRIFAQWKQFKEYSMEIGEMIRGNNK